MSSNLSVEQSIKLLDIVDSFQGNDALPWIHPWLSACHTNKGADPFSLIDSGKLKENIKNTYSAENDVTQYVNELNTFQLKLRESLQSINWLTDDQKKDFVRVAAEYTYELHNGFALAMLTLGQEESSTSTAVAELETKESSSLAESKQTLIKDFLEKLKKEDPHLSDKSIEDIEKNLKRYDANFITSMRDRLVPGFDPDAITYLIKSENKALKSGKIDKEVEKKWTDFKSNIVEDASKELPSDLAVLDKYVTKNNEIEERMRKGGVDYKTLIIEMQDNLGKAAMELFPDKEIGADQRAPLSIYLLGKSALSYDTLVQIQACLNSLDKKIKFDVEIFFPNNYLFQAEVFKSPNQ